VSTDIAGARDAWEQSRRWITTSTGANISGVGTGTGPPEVVLLHDVARSALSWEPLTRVLGLPAVALDLPGHGRSSWTRSGDYSPRRTGRPLAEAVRSFAPRHRLLVGVGVGALSALAAAGRLGETVGRLVLIDALPGTLADAHPSWPWPSPDFSGPEEAASWLRAHSPWLADAADPAASAQREVAHELAERTDGRWAWRHHVGALPETGPEAFDDPRLWDRLTELTIPPLLVRAENGPVSDAHTERFRATGGEVLTVPGTSHHVVTDRPDELADALRGAPR